VFSLHNNIRLLLKAAKVILVILSWAPFVWTALALFSARFALSISADLHYFLKDIVMSSLLFYFMYGGFLIWLFLNIFFGWKNIITKKQCLFYFLLSAAGLLCAYLCWQYDVFGLSGTFID
jgi:hypothetical protein